MNPLLAYPPMKRESKVDYASLKKPGSKDSNSINITFYKRKQ